MWRNIPFYHAALHVKMHLSIETEIEIVLVIKLIILNFFQCTPARVVLLVACRLTVFIWESCDIYRQRPVKSPDIKNIKAVTFTYKLQVNNLSL